MCELFAMSASQPTDVNRSLVLLRPRGGDVGPHADGWGITFYEGRAARVFREPVPAAESRCLAFIAEYDFRSSMVIGHIHKANPERIGRASANTHPFEREWNGRSWVFAHNGMLPGLRENPEYPVQRFRPLGETDSEYAFGVLLDAIAVSHAEATKGPCAQDIVRTIGPLVTRMAERGEFNFVMSNGESLIAHAHTRLYALRRSCRRDGCRQIVVLLATSPLTEEPWVQLASGSIHVYAHGQERSAVSRSTRGCIARATSKVSAVQHDQMR